MSSDGSITSICDHAAKGKVLLVLVPLVVLLLLLLLTLLLSLSLLQCWNMQKCSGTIMIGGQAPKGPFPHKSGGCAGATNFRFQLLKNGLLSTQMEGGAVKQGSCILPVRGNSGLLAAQPCPKSGTGKFSYDGGFLSYSAADGTKFCVHAEPAGSAGGASGLPEVWAKVFVNIRIRARSSTVLYELLQ